VCANPPDGVDALWTDTSRLALAGAAQHVVFGTGPVIIELSEPMIMSHTLRGAESAWRGGGTRCGHGKHSRGHGDTRGA